MLNRSRVILIAAILALLLPATAFSLRPGDLDPTFNAPKGYVMKNMYTVPGGSGNAMALQPDGKIVVVGQSNAGVLILRYQSNGDIDESFGFRGVATFSDQHGGTGNAIALQPDGKIVVVGALGGTGFDHAMMVLRFNNDGTIDNRFGNKGVATIACGLPTDSLTAVAIQPDGKIVVAGNADRDWPSYDDVLVMRFNNDGTVDEYFGNEGTVAWDNSSDDHATAIALQPDGKIVVVGYTGVMVDALILRFDSNGVIDNSFGDNGSVTYDSGFDDRITSVSLQTDGKIIVVGSSDYDWPVNLNSEVLVLRYDSNGRLDKTFGSNGVVLYGRYDDLGSPLYDEAYAVALQPDGKIVVAGNSGYGDNDILLLRLDSNGALDKSFGSDGSVIYDVAAHDYGRGVAIQSDGKVVVAGSSYSSFAIDNVLVLRYNSSGRPDQSFSGDGVATYSHRNGAPDNGSAVAIQADGKIVVAGSSSTIGEAYLPDTQNVVIRRYNSDGTLDDSFGIRGLVKYDSGKDDFANAIAIQPDGKIVIAGDRYHGSPRLQILRYNSDGTPDVVFGSNGVVIYNSVANYSGKAVVIQPDGKIVVSGERDNMGEVQLFIVRFNSDGTLDDGFGYGGVVIYKKLYDSIANGLALQNDNKIIVTGTSCHRLLILRYNSDGTLDKVFGIDGVVYLDKSTAIAGNAVAVQSNGDIIVVGDSGDYWPGDLIVLQFKSNGVLDKKFGNGGSFIYDSGGKDSGKAVSLQPDGKIVVVGESGARLKNSLLVQRYLRNGTLDKGFGNGGIVRFFSDSDAVGNSVSIQHDGKIVVAGSGWNNNNGSYDTLVMRLIGIAPPLAPSMPSAKAMSPSNVIVGWQDNSTDETGVRVERKSGDCSSTDIWKLISTVGVDITRFEDKKLSASSTYAYRVRAYNSEGSSAYSSCVSATTAKSGTPYAPQALQAVSVSVDRIDIHWQDNTLESKIYAIYRKAGSGPWIMIKMITDPEVTTHADMTATGNDFLTQYSYYLTACNLTGCSPATNIAEVPFVPTDVKSEGVGTGMIGITWKDNSSNETGFRIYRKKGACPETGAKWEPIATVDLDNESYTDVGLTGGSMYAYSVRAVARSSSQPYASGLSGLGACTETMAP